MQGFIALITACETFMVPVDINITIFLSYAPLRSSHSLHSWVILFANLFDVPKKTM
jgi:hypothetical protein